MLYNRIFILFFILILSGCNAPIYHQTESNVANLDQQMITAKQKMNEKLQPPPALVINQGLYIDKTPVDLAKQPTWLNNHIILRGDQLPFAYYSRIILGGGHKNLLPQYQPDLNQKVLLSMNYNGTVRGALDLLATKTGYVYSINGNHVYWQALVTKTFDIAFMPGSADYMVGGGSSSGGSTGAPASGSTGGASTAGTTVSGMDSSESYSSLKGSISVWKDLEDTIKTLLSSKGKVIVSQATTSVTVRDRPINVALISQFIKNMNSNLSKQVLVKIAVIQISLESDFNYGINWNLVQRAIDGGRYQLVSNNEAPVSLVTAIGLNTNSNTATLGIINEGINPQKITRDSGTQVLINALKQQGKVSVVTQPQVLCQNNQVSSIQLLDQQNYLASLQTTSLAGSSTPQQGASITSQITPGTFTTGFTLFVLPKIMGDKVYLQINANISTRIALDTITSNGAEVASGQAPPPGTSIIQAPHVQLKKFNQRSVIASGDTMILSGFKQVSNEVGASQLLDSQALGGKAAQQVSTETVIFITPYILRGLV